MAIKIPAFLLRYRLQLILGLTLAIGAGLAWWAELPEQLMRWEPVAQLLGDSPEQKPKPEKKETFYYVMDPMVVNVSKPNEFNRYLKVRPVLVTEDKAFYQNLKNYSPVIRNTLLSLYSQETVDSLLAENGFDALRAKSLDYLRKVQSDASLAAITGVMFNEFVIQ